MAWTACICSFRCTHFHTSLHFTAEIMQTINIGLEMIFTEVLIWAFLNQETIWAWSFLLPPPCLGLICCSRWAAVRWSLPQPPPVSASSSAESGWPSDLPAQTHNLTWCCSNLPAHWGVWKISHIKVIIVLVSLSESMLWDYLSSDVQSLDSNTLSPELFQYHCEAGKSLPVITLFFH